MPHWTLFKPGIKEGKKLKATKKWLSFLNYFSSQCILLKKKEKLPGAIVCPSRGPKFYPILDCGMSIFALYFIMGQSLVFWVNAQSNIHLHWGLYMRVCILSKFYAY